MKKPVIGIALGGGGALGMAHLGVLKALEKSGIVPDIVVGTSIGSIVGGLYAAGFNFEQLVDKALKIKTSKLIDLSFNPQGVFGGKAAEKTILSILGEDKEIETLPKKYACVAVDINKVEQVIYDSGSLVKAMRCSMSVPGVFVPVNDGDRLLVDGGLLNNVPADIARKMGADIVIAVNLVSEYIPHKPPKTIIDSVALSFFIMQKELTNYQLKDYDVLIAPKLTDYKQYIFNEDSSKGLIEMGYLEAKAQIRKIKYRINKFIKNNNKK